MARGPAPGKLSRIDHLANARAAWGENIPPEVLVLGQRCLELTARAVAQRLDYSPGLVSGVLNNTYHRGNLSAVFERIRERLMEGRVICPVLGEIAQERCSEIQRAPYSPTDKNWARMLHACSGCEHGNASGGESGS